MSNLSDPLQDREPAAERSDLGFVLEDVTAGENRMIGVAIVPIERDPLLTVPFADPPEPLEPSDDGEVQRVVTLWETASPEKLLDVMRAHVAEPVLALGAGMIFPVDEKKLAAGLGSEDFAEQRRQYPFHEPRKVTLSNWRIMYLGMTTVVATYWLQEEYQNGKIFGGNATSILMKNREGAWKITLFSKRTRFFDFLLVNET